ncbi:MAG TPA: hypothetical protein DDZ83_07760 [Nitrospinae bacterium]|nr:hypothetical protein [Nitrospinota bacterium]
MLIGKRWPLSLNRFPPGQSAAYLSRLPASGAREAAGRRGNDHPSFARIPQGVYFPRCAGFRAGRPAAAGRAG